MPDSKKSLNQFVGGLGISQSVTLSKPHRSISIWIIAAAGSVIVLLAALVFLYISNRQGNLAQKISDETILYARIIVPKNKIYNAYLKIFTKSKIDNLVLEDALKEINIIQWSDYSFARDVMPISSGDIELAILQNNEFVVTTKITQIDKWLSMFGIIENDYYGQVWEVEETAHGLWQHLSLESNNWQWYLEGNQLYIISAISAKEEINNKHIRTVSDLIKSGFNRNSIGSIYVNDKNDFLKEKNKYISSFFRGVKMPFNLNIEKRENTILFGNNNKINELNIEQIPSNIQQIYQVSDNESDISYVYVLDSKPRFSSLVSDNKSFLENTVSDINLSILELYNIDIASYLGDMDSSEFLLLFSNNQDTSFKNSDWILITDSAQKDILQQFATTLFAIEHPNTQEVRLSDNTIMTELRADIEGIEWDNKFTAYNGKDIEFSIIQGKGESNAYIIGEVPEYGFILSSSQELVDRVLGWTLQAPGPEPSSKCSISADLSAAVLIQDDFLSSDFSSVFQFDWIKLASDKNNNLAGCILLNSD